MPKKNFFDFFGKDDEKDSDPINEALIDSTLTTFFKKFLPANSLQEADTDTYQYTTYYFAEMVSNHSGLPFTTAVVYKWMDDHDYKFEPVPGQKKFCWLIKSQA